jgi:hypothetical protein
MVMKVQEGDLQPEYFVHRKSLYEMSCRRLLLKFLAIDLTLLIGFGLLK